MDIALTPPPSWTRALFLVVVAAVCGMLLWGVRTAAREWQQRVAIALALWLVITAMLPASGALAIDPIAPRLIAFFAGCNGCALALALSPLGARLASLPAAALVGFHSFRLPLEIVLERWADAGTVPPQMSWHGDNYDVLTGLAAIAFAMLLARRRAHALELAFHALGLGLLVRVATIAVLSAPVPFKAYAGPPLVLGLYAPYAWIVSVCVAGALAGQVIGIRAVLRDRRGRP